MTPDELKGHISLCIIKEASLDFFPDLLQFAIEWCKENGYTHPYVTNTKEGYYELLAKPKLKF